MNTDDMADIKTYARPMRRQMMLRVAHSRARGVQGLQGKGALQLLSGGRAGRIAGGTQLARIAKVDEPSTDLNPYWSPGWNYDEYSNYNPPENLEAHMVSAGSTNAKVGFKTWFGPSNTFSPPITAGRYGDGNAMDSTEMSALENLQYGLDDYTNV